MAKRDQLPVWIDGETAVATIDRWIKHDQVKHRIDPAAGRPYRLALIREWVLADDARTVLAVDAANEGSEEAATVLDQIGGDMIDQGVLPKSAAFRNYIRERLHHPDKSRRGRGHHEHDLWLRNVVIAGLMLMTVEVFGVPPTVNVASHRPSAAKWVSAALGRNGINVTPVQLAKVWTKHHPFLASYHAA